MIAHINIGSNLGDSRSTIERAVADVFSISEGCRRRSDIVESDPWGFTSPNKFLNIGVEIESTLPPLRLLERLVQVQNAICADSHRNADGSYRDRVVDIDLICYGNTRMATERLTLPHPRAIERPFVMGPLRSLHPDWPAEITDLAEMCL